jgi:hypothetical protein
MTDFLPGWSDVSRAFGDIPSLSKQINKCTENINLEDKDQQVEKQYTDNDTNYV